MIELQKNKKIIIEILFQFIFKDIVVESANLNANNQSLVEFYLLLLLLLLLLLILLIFSNRKYHQQQQQQQQQQKK